MFDYQSNKMYQWIFVLGLFFAFYNAWGIGANDCANSFATSVGAKVLTLKQAVIIASIFEFSGAVLMGSHVTDTVRKSIVSLDQYEINPGALMYGMLCADLASAIWLTIATYFKYPVSTTHSIIGAIVGFSLAYGGTDGVDWEAIGFIVLSWIASPFIAGFIALFVFSLIQKFVFRSANPFDNTLILFPILTFFTFFINVLFIIYKGTPNLELDELPLWICIVTSMGVGLITALCAQYLYIPYVKRKIGYKKEDEEKENTEEIKNNLELLRTESYKVAVYPNMIKNIDLENTTDETLVDEVFEQPDEVDVPDNFIYNEKNTLEDNINQSREYTNYLLKRKHESQIQKHHENAEHIDNDSDKLCSWIQIITACFSSFAHGSNDVANAIAPLATIYSIYQSDKIKEKADVPIWVLLLGGFGISVGLITWGYKIIDRIGRELTKITPSRGFVVELAAATTVIIASRAEIPVSTTHCQVGSVIGCGLSGGLKNINWKLVKGILFSWLITLPVTGLLSATLFSYGYYSPHEIKESSYQNITELSGSGI